MGEAALESQGVFLKVAGVETVRVKDVEVAKKTGDRIEAVKEDIERSAATYEQRIQVAPSQPLQIRAAARRTSGSSLVSRRW